jgi:hypothetical protein
MSDRHQPTGTNRTDGTTPNPREYIQENRDLLSRVLARGDTEAQAYALALIAEAGTPRNIDDIQGRLEDLRREADGGK